MQEDSAAPLARGRDALSRGSWEEARNCFEQAVRESGSGEAYEALSWAAWWQSDSEVVFSARERSHRLFLDIGDRVGAARMAMWLGVDYVDFRGELSIASGWRQRARRLLSGAPLSPEHAWLAVIDGDAALLLEEDASAARVNAQRARVIAAEVGVPDVEVLGLALDGIAAVSQGEAQEGMKLLDEAAVAALAGDLKEPFSVSWALCYLIYACERVRDYDRAAEWCERMREYAEKANIQFAQGVCRAHYAGVLLLRGDWTEAESELDAATELLANSRPAATVESLVRLA